MAAGGDCVPADVPALLQEVLLSVTALLPLGRCEGVTCAAVACFFHALRPSPCDPLIPEVASELRAQGVPEQLTMWAHRLGLPLAPGAPNGGEEGEIWPGMEESHERYWGWLPGFD